MSRGLDSSFSNEIQNTIYSPVGFLEVDLDTPLYFWTGYGNFEYSGTTYVGMGDLASVDTVEETDELAFRPVIFTMSGVPTDLLADMQTDVEGTTIRYKIGLMDTDGTLISAPHQVFQGVIDEVSIRIDPSAGSSSITVTSANVMAVLDRTKTERYTDVQQKADYSGDQGLEYIIDVSDKQIDWKVG